MGRLPLRFFAAGLLAAAATLAQQVTNVAGDTLTLSLGSNGGVRVGATGKLCTRQSVGGLQAEICSATFAVVKVDKTTSQARVTKGDPRSVTPGALARFDKTADPEKPRTKSPARSKAIPDDPLALAEAADRALTEGRNEEAVGLYQRLLKLIPGDPYALSQLQKGEAAHRDQLLKEEIRRRRRENATKVTYLERALDKATQTGDATSQRSYAQMILEIDPFDPEAVAVREEVRKTVGLQADEAAARWDQEAYLSAWKTFSTDWKDPDALARAQARISALFEGPFRDLDRLPCVEMPEAFNRISETLRGNPGFLRHAQDWLAHIPCGALPFDLESEGQAGLALLVLAKDASVAQEFVVRIEQPGKNVFEAGSQQIEKAGKGLMVLVPTGRELMVSVLPGTERKKGEPDAERKAIPALQGSEVKRICIGKGGLLRRALALKLDGPDCG